MRRDWRMDRRMDKMSKYANDLKVSSSGGVATVYRMNNGTQIGLFAKDEASLAQFCAIIKGFNFSTEKFHKVLIVKPEALNYGP